MVLKMVGGDRLFAAELVDCDVFGCRRKIIVDNKVSFFAFLLLFII